MASLADFVAIALTQQGDPYVFGAEAEFSDPNPRAFDCSELVQWAAGRCGIPFVDGAQSQRDACQRAGTLMEVDKGMRTRGALLFRISTTLGNHVVISLGDGQTIEARGAAYGVNKFSAAGRVWTDAGKVPGLKARHGRPRLQGIIQKGALGEDVRRIQRMLHRHGFNPGPADGVFGPRTEAAVRDFQTVKGLEVDGQVGPETRKALKKKP